MIAQPMLRFAMRLALELGKSLAEIKALPAAEFFQWHAYFSLTPEDLNPPPSVEDQLRAIFGKPKNA